MIEHNNDRTGLERDWKIKRATVASGGSLCVVVLFLIFLTGGGAAQFEQSTLNNSTFELEWEQSMIHDNTKILVEDIDGDEKAEIAVGDYTHSQQSRFGILSSNGTWHWKQNDEDVVWPKAIGNITADAGEQFLFKRKGWSGSNAEGNWVRPYSLNGSYDWSDGIGDLTDGVKTADYDDDGLTEVAATSNLLGFLKVWQENGELVWQVRSAEHVEIPYGFADANQDGNPEILTNIGNARTWRNKGLQLITQDGQDAVDQLWTFGEGEIIRPQFAQLDGDDNLEVYAVFQRNGTVQALDSDGARLWRVETPTTKAGGKAVDIVGDDTTDLIVKGNSSVSVVNGATQSVQTIQIGNKTQEIELHGDTIVYRTAREFGLATPERGVVENWTVDTNTTEIAVGDATDASGAEIVLAKRDAVQVFAVSGYEELLETDLQTQSGQKSNAGERESDSGNVPLLTRFSDSESSVALGILVILVTIVAFAWHRRRSDGSSGQLDPDSGQGPPPQDHQNRPNADGAYGGQQQRQQQQPGQRRQQPTETQRRPPQRDQQGQGSNRNDGQSNQEGGNQQ